MPGAVVAADGSGAAGALATLATGAGGDAALAERAGPDAGTAFGASPGSDAAGELAVAALPTATPGAGASAELAMAALPAATPGAGASAELAMAALPAATPGAGASGELVTGLGVEVDCWPASVPGETVDGVAGPVPGTRASATIGWPCRWPRRLEMKR